MKEKSIIREESMIRATLLTGLFLGIAFSAASATIINVPGDHVTISLETGENDG